MKIRGEGEIKVKSIIPDLNFYMKLANLKGISIITFQEELTNLIKENNSFINSMKILNSKYELGCEDDYEETATNIF